MRACFRRIKAGGASVRKRQSVMADARASPYITGSWCARRQSKRFMTASSLAPLRDHVPESRFGVWFLGTEIWAKHVLERALDDHERLGAERLIGVDIDRSLLATAAADGEAHGLKLDLRQASGSRLPLPDRSV